MNDFQKSLTRFLYVALVFVAVIAVWSLIRPAPEQSAASEVYGLYGRSGRGVTATGTCVVRTKPELAEVTIGVRQSAPSAKRANDYVKTTIRKIVAVLTHGGVAAKDIQTQHFRLVSVWDSGEGWSVKKWNAEESLQVRIRDMGKVADLVDQAVKAGANRVGSLNYTVEDVGKLRAKGRAKAARVAREKADELASQLGGKLGRLVACSENYPQDYDGNYWGDPSYYGGRNRYNAQFQMSADPEGAGSPDLAREELTLQPGEVVTTVVAVATYELD